MLFSQIIAFVLVMVVFEAYDPRQADLSLGGSLLTALLFLVLIWLATNFLVQVMLRRVNGSFPPRSPQKAVRRLIAILHGAGVVALAAMFMVSDIKVYLLKIPLLAHSQTLTGCCALALFFVVLGIVWYGVYPLERRVLAQPLSRLSYVASQARFVAPVVFPWLLVTALQDIIRLAWPSAHAWLSSETGDLAFLVLFMFILSLMFPPLVRSWWGCRPWPVGEVRRISSQVLQQAGVSVKAILDWPIMQGRIITAGVLGVFPGFRYLLITPALAESMSPDELAAVVAHEAGHVHYRHMLLYLFFFLGYFVLAYILSGPLTLVLSWLLYVAAGYEWGADLITSPDPGGTLDLLMALPLVIMMLFYLRFIMGYFMRHFERQADLFALALTGTAEHLASALETVATLSGNIRQVPSWHHFSVAQRVEHLMKAQRNPGLIRDEARGIAKGLVIYAACLALLGAGSFWLSQSGLHEDMQKGITLKIAERKLQDQILSPAASLELNILRFEGGREKKAIEGLEDSLINQPGNPEVLNTLAWFLVTAKDPDLRQPKRALRLAEMAVTSSPQPHIWDTYAEANYVNGRLRQAVAAAPRRHSRRAQASQTVLSRPAGAL